MILVYQWAVFLLGAIYHTSRLNTAYAMINYPYKQGRRKVQRAGGHTNRKRAKKGSARSVQSALQAKNFLGYNICSM